MSRLTEQELTEILDENKGISMVNPNRVYPPLPPAENIMPLMRIPEQATLCDFCLTPSSENSDTDSDRNDRSYRFKALKFDRRRGILYLHFILSCLLSERRKHCKDSRKKSPPCTVV